MKDLLSRAIAIAAKAHEGQFDRGGAPYILHPLRVMLAVGFDEDRQIAAVLHDVLEDTDVTVEDLADAGIHRDVIEAIVALTRLPGMSRMDAAKMAAANPIAMDVKIEDLRDNMDLRRIPKPGPKDYARLAEYNAAWSYLVAEQDKQQKAAA